MFKFHVSIPKCEQLWTVIVLSNLEVQKSGTYQCCSCCNLGSPRGPQHQDSLAAAVHHYAGTHGGQRALSTLHTGRKGIKREYVDKTETWNSAWTFRSGVIILIDLEGKVARHLHKKILNENYNNSCSTEVSLSPKLWLEEKYWHEAPGKGGGPKEK